MALTLPGLAGCFVVFAAASHDQLGEPLALVLAGCTLLASIADIDLDDRILIDASFVPTILAIAFLGPAVAFALVLVGTVGSWLVRRHYRAVVVPINVFGLGAPALLGAWLFQAVDPSGAAFYVLLSGIGLGGLVVNDLLVTPLMGVLDDAPIVGRLSEHVRLFPALAINVMFAVATAALLPRAGWAAIAIVLLAIIAFNYMVKQMLATQRQAKQVADLAGSRQRLVVQALDAEERQRRHLSERLHDEAIQDLLMARQDLAEAERGNRGAFRQTRKALDRALTELRGAVFDLHPTVLERGGLAPALKALAQQQARLGNFEVSLSVDPHAQGVRDRLLVAIIRELLRNIAQHANARRAEVRIARRNGAICLDVRDDGRGFHESARSEALRSGHIGLASAAERVEAAGGRFEFVNAPRGAHIRVTVPVDVADG
jgi:signal transduction histidine kinase